MLPVKFGLIWTRSFRGEDFFYSRREGRKRYCNTCFVSPWHYLKIVGNNKLCPDMQKES